MTSGCLARRILPAVLAAMLAWPSAGRADDYVSYTGTASALQSRKFLYREQHVLVAHDGRLAERVVLYTCRDGAPFARKTVSYVNPFAPNFVLEDASTGMREGVRSDGDRREVFFRAARVKAERSTPLPAVTGLVADAGFDEFVRANWQPLTGDKALSIHFLVPSRLDDMGFRVEALRSDHLGGVPVEVFRLRLAGVAGWLVPGIEVSYSAKDHVLMRYVGLSDLRDGNGENMKVDISFDPKDRKVAGQEALDAALHARLSPCG